MSGPVIRGGRVLSAPRPARLVDEVYPNLFLGGSWRPYELRGVYDDLLDCRWFPDDASTPAGLPVMVGDVAAAVRAGRRTLVRCVLGLNRSALVVGLAVRELTGRDGPEVVAHLRAVRSPHVLCNPHFAALVEAGCG